MFAFFVVGSSPALRNRKFCVSILKSYRERRSHATSHLMSRQPGKATDMQSDARNTQQEGDAVKARLPVGSRCLMKEPGRAERRSCCEPPSHSALDCQPRAIDVSPSHCRSTETPPPPSCSDFGIIASSNRSKRLWVRERADWRTSVVTVTPHTRRCPETTARRGDYSRNSPT